ncbi:MAG TPA: peptidase T [Bacteroidetes bacterium]|nr:peptidase T [Bacteroidota bacterium]
MKTVTERFLRYAKIDTQSEERSNTVPSTKKQLVLAKMLVKELKECGLKDASVDHNGYVMASLPANTDKKRPVIGWIAHMDTSPDFTAGHVNPQIHRNYDGKEIILNKKENIILSPADFPELLDYVGQDLITTDGTTLLGADDKAGIAGIMTALAYLQEHPEIQHSTLKVAFTPDEEIGRGADHFDVKKFGADFAYTVDGGRLGELEYENFNAALATVTLTGRNVHPGTAKDKMINSMHLAMEFNALLPPSERPEHTEGYEGFYHLIDIQGAVEQTTMRYLVRDHDRSRFEQRKKFLKECASLIRIKYGSNSIRLDVRDQYYNMKEKIEPVKYIIDLAREAMVQCGVTPIVKPIRGGTDGARLSYMGLPTPNLFTGGHNFHGRFEFIPISSMEKAVKVIVRIIENSGRLKR